MIRPEVCNIRTLTGGLNFRQTAEIAERIVILAGSSAHAPRRTSVAAHKVAVMAQSNVRASRELPKTHLVCVVVHVRAPRTVALVEAAQFPECDRNEPGSEEQVNDRVAMNGEVQAPGLARTN
jgi:hypothetical protein